MKEGFLYSVWCWLLDTFGFNGATTILYVGFPFVFCFALWKIMKISAKFYKENR